MRQVVIGGNTMSHLRQAGAIIIAEPEIDARSETGS